jgi:hypothetical protein
MTAAAHGEDELDNSAVTPTTERVHRLRLNALVFVFADARLRAAGK